jgi:hypothetical protein
MTTRAQGSLLVGFLLVLCLLAGAQQLLADTIYFRDGREANGRIVSQSDTRVTIQTATGTWTYNRADITRIDYDPVSPSTTTEEATVTAPQLPAPSAAPAAPVQPVGVGFGGSLGLLLFPDAISLASVGAFVDMQLSSATALRLAYCHAGASLYGLEVVGINMLEASLTLDVAPESPFGVYVMGGATYLMMNALGEGLSGMLFLGGGGIRLSPSESVAIRVGYVGRFKYDVLHSVVAEVAFRF